MVRHPHRDLVRDHLRARAQSAEQRVLVVRRPAGEHDAVHAERRDREDEQEADRQSARAPCRSCPTARPTARANGITAHVSSAGMNDITGARMNSGVLRRVRVRLFLHDVLDAVGDRLQPARVARRDSGRADPGSTRDLPLGQRQHRRRPPCRCVKMSSIFTTVQMNHASRSSGVRNVLIVDCRSAACAASSSVQHHRATPPARDSRRRMTLPRAGRACRSSCRRTRDAPPRARANTSLASE